MADMIHKNVEWRDLLSLSQREIVQELLISLPWLLSSLFFAYYGWYLIALGASFMFFLTGLRQAHDIFHKALGLKSWCNEIMLYLISCLMLGSVHAVKITHLLHHRYCLQEEDIEGKFATKKWWQVIFIYGPIFPFLQYKKAWEVGTKKDRCWIAFELLTSIVLISSVFFFLNIPILAYHYSVMLIGHIFSAFFAVWAVHHDAEDHVFRARTIRNPIKGNLSYQTFYHAEHHLFPAVPTKRLPILAKRIDEYLPDLEKRLVY